MPVVSIRSFGGIAPVVPARFLKDNQAQVALNCPTFEGSLQPLRALGSSLLTLPKSGTPKTIYRFGQDLASDTQWWFHWDKDVDVCRGQIAGDTSEWTFYTGDGAPKATYAAIATSGSEYPSVSRELGLPAPTVAPTVATSGSGAQPTLSPATVVLTPSVLQYFGAPYDSAIEISTTTDADSEYVSINPASGSVQDVEAAINASAVAVTATADGVSGTVTVETDAEGASASLFIRYTVGDNPDTSGAFTAKASPDKSASGTANTITPRVILEDNEIGGVASGDTVTIETETSAVFTDLAATSEMTESELATWINNNAGGKVSAQVYGSCVVISPGTEGSGASGSISYTRKDGSGTVVTEQSASGSSDPAPAELLLEKVPDLDAALGEFIQLEVNAATVYEPVPVGGGGGIFKLDDLTDRGVNVEYFGTANPFAILKTNVLGSNSYLRYRVGDYVSGKDVLSASGTTSEVTPVVETRVYVYTWVAEEAGFAMESAPSPASSSVDVEFGDGQSVDVSGFDSVPGGAYVVTAKRIYRSVNGVYLFVAETAAATSTYNDSVDPAALGEEMPSLYWSPPPSDLKGIVNLPNGMVAGFRGRDVYFCEPYRPYAWPEPYMQTVDYPVVGLASMDTTLAVLTTGVPYFMQGSHPDSVAVVKSDIEQACVSKRSISSMGSGIVYASPDGLMFLSPGGSRNLTEQLFDYKTWQEHFAPESIHAYNHDNQYIAFYDNGTTQGGFIFDLPSGQFTLHDIYATAGYQDRQRDKLFLAQADKTLRVWDSGGGMTYRWRSKKFTMPEPLSFSCAQVEAENYPVTMRVYLDGQQLHEKAVASRRPFRLPSKVGRDWEIEIEGDHEVFSAGLSTSMTEFAGA